MSGPPKRIGRYTVVEELGSGGMGKVFLAYSPGGDPVAVKVIRGDRLDQLTRARFEREALIARTVVGTNRVARFLDADPYAEQPWLAMQFVAGRTLLAHVDDHGVLPFPLVASLGALLSEGLAAVHGAGLVHRDLKPQNIVLGADGPMIIDFGLGAFMDRSSHESLSHSGMIIGTVRCMPPEQASGHPHVEPPADVYALGTVLLYAAACHYPYNGAKWEAIAAQIVSPDIAPDLSGVPHQLVPLLASMLSHAPEDRPSVTEVAAECSTLLDSAGLSPVEARHALIARTTGHADLTSPAAVSAEVEKLLEQLLLETDAESGPLDLPPADDREARVEEKRDDPPQDDAEPVTPRGGGRAPAAKAESASRRRPASERVAGELRARYAAQSAL